MASRHVFKTFIFIMLAGVMVLASGDLLTGKDASKKRKMYISGIKGENVKKSLLDRIRNGITLSVLDNYGSTYQVLDDEAVKVMYSQAEKILSSGCTDTSCMTQIADGINADEIVFGEVTSGDGKIRLVMKSLVRRDMELDNKVMVIVSFKESQTDWFAAETAKRLVDPNYKIDPSKAPQEFDASVDIKGINIGGVETFGIEVMKFTTNDDQIQNILGYLKELVKSGDDLLLKKEYEDSIDNYKTVIEKIDTKLRPESRAKMKTFRDEVVNRIDTSYAMMYKVEMEKVDSKIRGVNDADESFLNKMIGKYNDVKNDMKKDVPQQYYGKNAVKIENAIHGRIESCLVSICLLHEKLGDTAYSEYRFDGALAEYNKSLETALKMTGDERGQAEERCSSKITATYKTGKSYLENKVRSYTDLAEFYNVKDETSKAKKMLKEALSLMKGGMINFLTESAVLNYNTAAGILGVEVISSETETKLYAKIEENKRNEKDAEQRRLAAEGLRKLQQNIAEMRKKGCKMEMVMITGGTFMMGSENGDSGEKPVHRVRVDSFYISVYEVTQKQYYEITGTNPSSREGDDFPVHGVSWEDAMEFCRKLSEKYNVNARLPYEAEWEYACRAGTTSSYYWGDEVNGDYCWYGGNSGERTHPVGQKKPNAWGLYDMSGNVWEYCMDWYQKYYYIGSPSDNPKGPSDGSERVLRGGSWFLDIGLRSAYRSGINPGQITNSGIRVVVSR